MASTKRPPSDPPGARRRRSPPVINLEATEVPPPGSESAPAADTPAPQQQAAETSIPMPDKPSEGPFGREAFEPPPPPPPEPAIESAPPPTPPEPPRPSEASQPKATEQRAAEQPIEPPPSGGPPRQTWSPVMAGLSGAAGGLVLFLLLWMFGAFSNGQPVSAPIQASAPDFSPRLAAIEQQLKDIAARPAPAAAAADPRALNDIAARLARLESAVAAPRAPVTDPAVLSRITAAENAAKATADNVAGMSRRIESLEAALRETNGQIEKLSAATAELQTRVRETGAGSDRASRMAVAAAALRAAVERGDAYAAELAIVKPLTSDAASVAALEPFAASGVPSPATLGQELAAVVRPMLAATTEAPRDGGFLEKLQANAEKLVRIRPIEEARGDDRVAVLTRIEQRAAQGNVGGALTEFAKLPAEARAPLQAWTAKAEARTKAVEASRRLAADAVAALKAAP
jgi:hypothetical protein